MAVIPPKKLSKDRPSIRPGNVHTARKEIERFFAKHKQFRRIATCDETLGSTFLAFIHLTASGIIVGAFVNTP